MDEDPYRCILPACNCSESEPVLRRIDYFNRIPGTLVVTRVSFFIYEKGVKRDRRAVGKEKEDRI
jgi:hypothetical protein